MALNDKIDKIKIDDITRRLKEEGLNSIVDVGKTILLKNYLNITIPNPSYSNADTSSKVLKVLEEVVGRGTTKIKPLHGSGLCTRYLEVEYIPFKRLTYKETEHKTVTAVRSEYAPTPGSTPYEK